METPVQSVAVIGAGITGLTAGFHLQQLGIPVAVYEAGAQAGGVIRSLRQDGFLAEFGPNTVLETSPRIGELVRAAGLEERRLYPSPRAEARYVVRYQRPMAMPGSPLGFFSTRLFGWGAKWAVLREPFIPRKKDAREESIAEFVLRRLNREFLDQAIDALAAGIYAGDPARLSVTQAFPRLARAEEKYGSLIKSQILGARERRKSREVAKDRAPKFSFDEGLQVLPDTLCRKLGRAVQLNTRVVRVQRSGASWQVTLRQTDGSLSTALHGAVVYAGTAYGLAELELEHARPVGLKEFSQVRYPPVASVVLGFRRQEVAHPCEGFGMLIPRVEKFQILGTIFSSSLFPNRAPAGHLTLTSYVGGERQPQLAGLPEEEIYALTCQDLKVLLGVRGKPVFQNLVRYPRAIPQYNLGYGRFRERLTALEMEHPGLFFAGQYRDGISLGDCIVSGFNVMERVRNFVSPGASV